MSPETKEKVNDAIKQRKEAMDNHLAPVERYRGDIRLEYDKMSKKRKSRIVNQITVQLPRVKILKAIRDEVQKFYIDRRSR